MYKFCDEATFHTEELGGGKNASPVRDVICNAQCVHGENLFSACKDTPFFSHEETIGKKKAEMVQDMPENGGRNNCVFGVGVPRFSGIKMSALFGNGFCNRM